MADGSWLMADGRQERYGGAAEAENPRNISYQLSAICYCYRPFYNADSISRAIAMSFSVIPPSLCVDSAIVTVS